MQSPRALIVEDDALTRDWLAECVTKAFGKVETVTADCVAKAKEAIGAFTPDIALVDLGLPDGSGVTVIEALRVQVPDTHVVVVTLSDDDRDLFRALRAGARGYILKDVDADKVVSFLRGIDTRPALSERMAERMIERLNREGAEATSVNLAPRELDVLRLVAKGYSTADCARLLELSPNTTKSYMKTIHQKLGVNSRAEATVAAVRLGLVDP